MAYRLLRKYRGTALLLLLAFALALGAQVPPAGAGTSAGPEVLALTVKGPIVPAAAHYIGRGIAEAEKRGVPCLIRLSTPGGLYGVTQEIVTKIVNARVPVIVYVSPSGSWAASAGAFITLSAHCAAMAPGTRLGAAHPVALGGEEEKKVPAEKITADAAAWMRSLAELRGRNAALAEEMVTKSRSFSAEEALSHRLVDLVAGDENELCCQLSGRQVTLAGGRNLQLELAGARVTELAPTWPERFLWAILNPDVAYLLVTMGMAGIMVEIYHPGLIFPGVLGSIALLLGLYSLGTLDAYWVGLMLILLGLGFLIAEAFVTTHGILGTGGVLSFFFGSLLLFSTHPGGMRVSTGLVAATTVTLAGLTALLVTAAVRGQKRPVQTGTADLVGREALARTDLAPEGLVFVAGEYWQARLEEGSARAGERLVVTAVEGLRLVVRRKAPPG